MGRVLAALALLLPVSAAAPQEVGRALEGRQALRDLRGNRRSLREFKGYDATVVAFLGAECPLSNLYVPRLLELEKEYRPRKVKFVAAYPNENETADAVAAHAEERSLPFLVLKDYGQKLADAMGVQRTPEVALLDRELVLRYRGRVDDQYGTAYRKEAPGRKDLVEALEELLAGRAVATPQTEADGCLLARRAATPGRAGVTYARDVAPLLQKKCQSCHRAGQAGPFPLLTYADAADHAGMIKEVVQQRRMPPWHADRRHGKFSNDRSLTPEEVGTIAAWADAGAPRGAPQDEPAPVRWPEGWSIGTPDAVLALPREIEVPAAGTMDYMYFTVPTGFGADRWVQKAEVRPGDPRVVHHVLVYVKMPGKENYQFDGTASSLVGWAPGDMPLENPPGTAIRIPKEAELQFEVHYTPNGKATRDRTSVGLIFAKEPPAREVRTNIFAKIAIRIPAGAPHHREELTMTMKEDVRLLTLMPHMHLRGKSWFYEAIYADGRKETLLSVPRWDFNWQSVYRLETPVPLPKGTRLRAVAHWDNSDNNPANPNPSKVVRYGLQTWEEMMNGWVQWVPQ